MSRLFVELVLWVCLLLPAGVLPAQEDPVLFKIDDFPVYASEFLYIYEKNNRESADYSRSSVEEYLDLYINFKLKVKRAKELKYHERDSYIRELAGYRKQLSNSYVIDKEVIGKMAEELYERQKWDVGIKHILVRASRNESVEGAAYAKISSALEELKGGISFEEVVEKYSEDQNSVKFGGDIGFVAAPLPDGYVELERSAFRLNPGEISEIIRTDLGLHIISVSDKRPARGEMEGSHILIRYAKKNPEDINSKRKIDSLYQVLEEGKRAFESLAISYSQDRQTAPNGGYLGYFGIGKYEEQFEKEAFGLLEDGDYTAPFKSSIGWHIVKRKTKKQPYSREALKERVKSNMQQGERFELAKEEFVEQIKREEGFSMKPEALQVFMDSLDDSFREYQWRIPDFPDLELFSIGQSTFNLRDFGIFCKSSTRARLRSNQSVGLRPLVDDLRDDYIAEMVIDHLEKTLEDRYADFANLIREYEEGILLFEITKEKVWDRAASDSTGLKTFYEDHKEDYQWGERAKITTFTIRSTDEKLVHEISREAIINGADVVTNQYNQGRNPDLVIVESEVIDRMSEAMGNLEFKKGSLSPIQINNGLQVSTFRMIEEIMPARPKNLREARGYVISDYQDQLEKAWIESLKTRYTVDLNLDVLEGLIRSE